MVKKMNKVAILVMCLLVATAASPALAWGPNDPTDKKADPDGDKLGNLDEFRAGTNPLNPDSDGGGCWDGWEVMYRLDPTNADDDRFDSDNDGWTNLREFREGTDPRNPNTDSDCFPIDSTDPHPLIPDGRDPTDGPGVPPGKYPVRPRDPTVFPNPLPPGPPIPVPPEPDTDYDHDGLVEFIEGM